MKRFSVSYRMHFGQRIYTQIKNSHSILCKCPSRQEWVFAYGSKELFWYECYGRHFCSHIVRVSIFTNNLKGNGNEKIVYSDSQSFFSLLVKHKSLLSYWLELHNVDLYIILLCFPKPCINTISFISIRTKNTMEWTMYR